MRFEWDPAKSAETFRRRGFDFSVAIRVFEHRIVEFEDSRYEYGERRFRALGVVDGLRLSVIYTDRTYHDGIVTRRIISARRMNRKERRIYEEDSEP